MAKRRRKKRKKRRVRLPDEEAVVGPLHLSRYGKLTRWRLLWGEEDHAAYKKGLRDDYASVVAEIDALVDRIAETVSSVCPIRLMLASRHFFELCWFRVRSEAEAGLEEVTAYRMLDYVQSLIASVDPPRDISEDLTEESWQQLFDQVNELFSLVSGRYLLCWMAKREEEYDKEETAADLQIVLLTGKWMQVRGLRYHYHDRQYVQDVFVSHTNLLKQAYGITGHDLAEQLTAILSALTRLPDEAMDELEQVRRTTKDRIGGATVTDNEFQEVAEEVAGGRGALADAMNRALGPARYDVGRTTDLPPELLEDLSWSPGEDEEFMAPGDYRGWPLRIWPVFKRPFIRLAGRTYCFEPSVLFDHIYRVVQRAVCRRIPDGQERWNRSQNALSERLTAKYFQKLLPGAECWSSVYYRARNGAWCEADLLVAYDEHLFVVECRAGSFTYTDPATDFRAHVASLENLVLKPAQQGHRFVDYLRSDKSVGLYDRRHRMIGSLSAEDFGHICVCGVTLDVFTELASRTRQLMRLGLDVDATPIWSLSIDDLRLFSDVFRDPMVFLHFVQQRMRAVEAPTVLEFHDELDHLGLYFTHGDYVTHFAERHDDFDSVELLGYRVGIDHFFSEKMRDADAEYEPARLEPRVLGEIVGALGTSSRRGRFRVARRLLDLAGHERMEIEEAILGELKSQTARRRRRAKAISTTIGKGLTIFCWMPPWSLRNSEGALQHGLQVAFVNMDESRLLLEVTFDRERRVTGVSWEWLDTERIQGRQRQELIEGANRIRAARVKEAQGRVGKLGRNAACPCGSGKKWKRCCLLSGT